MKFNIFFVVLFFIILKINFILADDNIIKLKKLLDKGLITENEFKTLTLSSDKQKSNNKINVRKDPAAHENDKFIKYEFYIDNYRVHTLNPGIIRIDNMLTGETDVTLSSNFKVKFSKEAKNIFDFVIDENNESAELNYKGKKLINWKGKYVRQHQATFYQMQVFGYIPFHFYIKIPGKKIISLNMDKFNRKIEKAVNKVKEEMALKYNLSLSDIDKIMQSENDVIDNEVDKVIKELTEKYAGQEITEAIQEEIKRTVGEEMADAFISAIEDASGQAIDAAIEAEIANYLNEAISYAVQQGVNEAAATAALEAMLWVYAMGGTDEQAMDACRYYAGDAC